MGKNKTRLSNLNRIKKVEYRDTLQDWDIWLSKPDHKGNDVNLHLENIYLKELHGDGLVLYEQLQLKFKNPLVGAEQFYLQYKLPSEHYPINIELSKREQALAAFKKFSALRQEDYVEFGPVLVLYCRGPLWTTARDKVGIKVTSLKGRPTLTRYLTEKYSGGKLSLSILDEMMTLALGGLRRAVHGVMPDVEREHHGYLMESLHVNEPSPEELFKAGTITLKDYEDIRFPEGKLERQKRDAHYPIPEDPRQCIVCRETTATMSCMECRNKVCQTCLRRVCLEKGHSFLYFHHQHCLKFGRPCRHPLPEADDLRRRGMPGRGDILPTGHKRLRKKQFRPPSGTRPRQGN